MEEALGRRRDGGEVVVGALYQKTLSKAGHLGPVRLAQESLPCSVSGVQSEDQTRAFVEGCWFDSPNRKTWKIGGRIMGRTL